MRSRQALDVDVDGRRMQMEITIVTPHQNARDGQGGSKSGKDRVSHALHCVEQQQRRGTDLVVQEGLDERLGCARGSARFALIRSYWIEGIDGAGACHVKISMMQ